MGYGAVARRAWIAAVCAVIAGSTLGARAEGVEQQGGCGNPGQAPCPMQAFMRASVATPLASNDGAALAAGLERAGRLAPEATWASWATFASDGAAAARRGDVAGARAACKGCHDAWREKYRAGYRARPLPR